MIAARRHNQNTREETQGWGLCVQGGGGMSIPRPLSRSGASEARRGHVLLPNLPGGRAQPGTFWGCAL